MFYGSVSFSPNTFWLKRIFIWDLLKIFPSHPHLKVSISLTLTLSVHAVVSYLRSRAEICNRQNNKIQVDFASGLIPSKGEQGPPQNINWLMSKGHQPMKRQDEFPASEENSENE